MERLGHELANWLRHYPAVTEVLAGLALVGVATLGVLAALLVS